VFSFSRKIEFPNEATDPDINGEGIPTAIGIKKNTSGYLWSDSGKGFQPSGSFRGGKRSWNVQYCRVFCKNLGGSGKVTGPVSQRTAPEGYFSSLEDDDWRRENTIGSTQSRSQSLIDLLDLYNLLQGRADKVAEAFPWIFSNRPESGMALPGCIEMWIRGGE
jgi:hypothetical protein